MAKSGPKEKAGLDGFDDLLGRMREEREEQANSKLRGIGECVWLISRTHVGKGTWCHLS